MGGGEHSESRIENDPSKRKRKFLNYYFYWNFSLLSFQLANIHLSWDLIINRNTRSLGGLIYSLESFLQLNVCQELQIFAFLYMYLDAS
jgi:hypothetical protein